MSKTTDSDRQQAGVTSWGLDPGKRACGLALVEGDKVLAVMVVRVPRVDKRWEMPSMIQKIVGQVNHTDVFVVENQQAYGRGKADPNDLISLAHVAGAAVGAATWRAKEVHFPLPKEWKKGIPKGAHQARVLDQLGWSYEFDGPKRPVKNVQIPEEVDRPKHGIPDEHMSEVVDAIGLALWGVSRAAV